MAPVVEDWLLGQGLAVKREFGTPVGVADLVGCRLDPSRVSERFELGQKATLANGLRAAIWLSVPRCSRRRTISEEDLASRFAEDFGAEEVSAELSRLVATRLLERSSRGGLRRPSPWYPLQERIVAVELKRERWARARAQAVAYCEFASESYVALSEAAANRVSKSELEEAPQIGLLSVSASGVRVVKPASQHRRENAVSQSIAVEAFWPQACRS